ncbi:MAG TPA: histidine--tRNA ligase [Candidatus Acidoferrales bacterium]|nr:histidine--tRNA ligase [Candidatus Acidoferrales bacterium]
MTALTAVRGMNDILPGETPRWRDLETTMARLLLTRGYQEIRLPMVEHTALFQRSIGEVTDIVEKEMYTFVDRGGDSLSLRPEGTAGCVRAMVENGLLAQEGAVHRLWYAGPMFRHERPQKGRYRQFHQIGVEAFGMPGPDIDAEQIVLCARLWEAMGITGSVKLHINSLGTPTSRAVYRKRLVDYFTRHAADLDEDSRRRLMTNPLRILDSKNPDLAGVIAGAPSLLDSLDDVSRAHFEGLCRLLDGAGVSYTHNPRLVRGLDYYTHTVFEWITDRLGAQDAVCSGGRYDGLVSRLGGRETPAVGFALGMERVIALLDQADYVPPSSAPDCYLVWAGEGLDVVALQLAEDLRRIEGLRVVQHCGGGSFKAQLKRADRSGARFAIILGEQEWATRSVQVKPLREDQPQKSMPASDLSSWLLAQGLGRSA